MNRKKILYAAAATAALVVAYAAYAWQKDKSLAQAFCTALSDDASYARDGLDQYKKLIPGRDGWVFRTDNDFRTDFSPAPETKDYLLAMQRAFSEKGIDLVIAFPPMRGTIHANRLNSKDRIELGVGDTETAWANYEKSIAELRAAGLHVVGVGREDASPEFYYSQNHHWSAAGARQMAAELAGYIKNKIASYQQIEKASYMTTERGTATYESSFNRPLGKICGTSLPSKSVKIHVTSPTGGETTPEIVLLGTSNSVQESSMANFDGFLKERLGASVLNLSYIGAGIDTSIISFLNSDLFKSGAIRIAIWEVPGYYDFNIMDDKLFKQIIPAIHGGCTDAALQQDIAALKRGRETLFDLGGQALSPDKNYYLRLSFSQPVREEVALKLNYGDVTRKLSFNRAERYPADGVFYSLFPLTDNGAPIQKVMLETPASLEGTALSTQVCMLP